MDDRRALGVALTAAVGASIGAAAAKQSLGRVLRAAEAGPVAVTRNGAIEAYIVSARWLEGGPRPLATGAPAASGRALLLARAAETERDEIRRERLARQLRARDSGLRRAARERLDQWERECMLAPDIIAEWREILRMPRGEAIERACADAPHARLLRKSSPFMGLKA